MKIQNVVILANPSRSEIGSALAEMEDFFGSRGISTCRVMLTSTVSDNSIRVPLADMAVSLGGDGTVLSCASILRKTGTPLFAVNLGTFGYLAKISLSEYKFVFDSFERGRSGLDVRMRLKATVFRDGDPVYEDSALNEFTATAASRARQARFSLGVNGTRAARLRGDGILFATPSGSTGYNLSAGGPILDESISSIIINPICPFTMGARPLVVSDSSRIELQVDEAGPEMILTCDGHEGVPLRAGDKAVFEKSPVPTRFVANPERNFIEVLRDKLGWAGSPVYKV